MSTKRSITIDGKQTSVSLEEPFWIELRRLADEAEMSLASYVFSLRQRGEPNAFLSTTLRLHVVRALKEEIDHLRARVAELTPKKEEQAHDDDGAK